jgi:hypothetical protein
LSLYQLHKAIYTYLNTPEGERDLLDGPALREQFELTDSEVEAFRQTDIVALTRLGVHPVLLNSYVRGRRIPRDAYRAALQATAETG